MVVDHHSLSDTRQVSLLELSSLTEYPCSQPPSLNSERHASEPTRQPSSGGIGSNQKSAILTKHSSTATTAGATRRDEIGAAGLPCCFFASSPSPAVSV